MAFMVASISFDIVMPDNSDIPSASAAHITARCAQLFDAGIFSLPFNTEGFIKISISALHKFFKFRNRNTSDFCTADFFAYNITYTVGFTFLVC